MRTGGCSTLYRAYVGILPPILISLSIIDAAATHFSREFLGGSLNYTTGGLHDYRLNLLNSRTATE